MHYGNWESNISNHLKVAAIYMAFQMEGNETAQKSLSSLRRICFTPNDLAPSYCS